MFLARASVIVTVRGLSLDIFSHLPSISRMLPLLAASISKLFDLCVVLALLMFSQIAGLKEDTLKEDTCGCIEVHEHRYRVGPDAIICIVASLKEQNKLYKRNLLKIKAWLVPWLLGS